MTLAKDNYELLFKFVVLVLTDYFNYSHPVLLPSANRIAADLIDTRPTWKAADFVNLCKFFRQNPNLVKTQASMTPEIFVANVSIYEGHRAQEFEKFRQEEQGKFREENRTASPLVEKIALKLRADGKVPTGSRTLGKIAEQTAANQEEKRMSGKLNVVKVAPDENYFKKEYKKIAGNDNAA